MFRSLLSLVTPWIVAAAAIFEAVTCTALEPLQVREAIPADDLNARFAQARGWVGADGNYSVVLAPDRILWLYSDTWIGEVSDGRRKNCTMINNSVGVQSGQGEQTKVEYSWGVDSAGKPTALIRPADGHGWFWLFGGAFAGERLHLLLFQMEKADGPAAFGFRNVAVWYALVKNPRDEPTAWQVEQHKLPFTELSEERRLLFGSAVMQYDGHTYIYGIDERPQDRSFGRRMVLARVKSSDMGKFDEWRFRTADDWSADFRQSEPLAPGVAAEFSVMRLPGEDRFALVTNDVFLSPTIIARVSQSPWGPWSAPSVLYTCPETKGSKSIFCYAGKAHAALSSPGELVISYAANTTNFGELFSNARLYWPRYVRVKLAR